VPPTDDDHTCPRSSLVRDGSPRTSTQRDAGLARAVEEGLAQQPVPQSLQSLFTPQPDKQADDVPSDTDEQVAAEGHPTEVLFEAEDKINIDFQEAPIQLTTDTTLHRMHVLFILMQLRVAFVTEKGHVVGVVTRSTIKQALEDKNPFYGQ